MSMYDDIIWRSLGNGENCAANSLNVATYAKGFHSDVGHIWDLVLRKSGMDLASTSQMVSGNRVAENMMINFAVNGHPKFQATSPLKRGELKSKGAGKKTHSP